MLLLTVEMGAPDWKTVTVCVFLSHSLDVSFAIDMPEEFAGAVLIAAKIERKHYLVLWSFQSPIRIQQQCVCDEELV